MRAPLVRRLASAGAVASSVLAVLLWTAPSAAVTITSDTRWVRALSCNPPPNSNVCDLEQVLTQDGPALYDESVTATNSVGESGTATQHSVVGPQGVSATGSISTAFTLAPVFFADVSNRLNLSFSVGAPTPWSIDVSSSIAAAVGSAQVRVILTHQTSGTEVFYRQDVGTLVFGPDHASGVLAPGDWTLEVTSYTGYTNEIGWSVALAVPEPGAGVLLALGLLAFGARARLV